MRNKTYLITFLVSIFLAFAVNAAQTSIPFFQSINLKGRDFYFQIRHAFSPALAEANEILLVAIDDESLKRLEKNWPFPRSTYVDVLNRLKPFSPKAIGFDLIFSGKDLVPANDIQFSSALKEAGNVVIASHQSSAGEIGPESIIGSNAWQIGIVDKPRDPDQVIRRVAFYFSLGGTIFPSWEAAVFNRAFGKSLAFDLSQNFVIDYRLKPADFSTVPFWRLLEGSVLADELRNKIILIGPTAEVFHDIHETPLGRMPGIAINANVLTMLMRGYLFSFPPKKFVLLINFFSIWFVLLLALTRTLRKGFWPTCLLIGFYLGVGYWAFLYYKLVDLWLLSISMFDIFLAATLFRYANIWFFEYQLKRESKPDPLTGFYTEKFLCLRLHLELNRAVNANHDLILLMVKINRTDSDEHDKTLLEAGHLLRSSIRKKELVCRYEDLFVIILPNTNSEDAARFGEKIEKAGSFKTAVVSSAKSKISEPHTLLEAGRQALGS